MGKIQIIKGVDYSINRVDFLGITDSKNYFINGVNPTDTTSGNAIGPNNRVCMSPNYAKKYIDKDIEAIKIFGFTYTEYPITVRIGYKTVEDVDTPIVFMTNGQDDFTSYVDVEISKEELSLAKYDGSLIKKLPNILHIPESSVVCMCYIGVTGGTFGKNVPANSSATKIIMKESDIPYNKSRNQYVGASVTERWCYGMDIIPVV